MPDAQSYAKWKKKGARKKIKESRHSLTQTSQLPKTLSFVCPHCGERYRHEFTSAGKVGWQRELDTQTDCPQCGKSRNDKSG